MRGAGLFQVARFGTTWFDNFRTIIMIAIRVIIPSIISIRIIHWHHYGDLQDHLSSGSRPSSSSSWSSSPSWSVSPRPERPDKAGSSGWVRLVGCKSLFQPRSTLTSLWWWWWWWWWCWWWWWWLRWCWCWCWWWWRWPNHLSSLPNKFISWIFLTASLTSKLISSCSDDG